jgi:hypothetical protein
MVQTLDDSDLKLIEAARDTTTPAGTDAAPRFGLIEIAACMLPPMSTAVDSTRSWIEGHRVRK